MVLRCQVGLELSRKVGLEMHPECHQPRCAVGATGVDVMRRERVGLLRGMRAKTSSREGPCREGSWDGNKSRTAKDSSVLKARSDPKPKGKELWV